MLSLYTWYQNRPRRRLGVAFTHVLGPEKGYPENLVGITFVNERGPTVVLEEVGFEHDRKRIAKTRFFEAYDDRLPKEVPSGHAASYYFDLEDLRNKPTPGKAYCRDATGYFYETSLEHGITSALLVKKQAER